MLASSFQDVHHLDNYFHKIQAAVEKNRKAGVGNRKLPRGEVRETGGASRRKHPFPDLVRLGIRVQYHTNRSEPLANI